MRCFGLRSGDTNRNESMSSAAVRVRPISRHGLRLSGVDWKKYGRFLDLFAERRGFRLTYDQGEMEIMSPSLEHDDEAWFLGDMVFVLTTELGLPLRRGGAT